MSRTGTTAPVHYPPLLWLTTTAVIGVLVGVAITAAGPVPGVVEPGAVVSVGLPVVRVLLDVAAVVTVGLSMLPKLLGFDRPRVVEPILVHARAGAVASSAVWVVCSLVALVLQTADLFPGESITVGDVVEYVHRIGAGQGLVIVATFALLNLVLAVLAVRLGESVPAEARIAVAMFTLLPLPVTGHAANTGTNLHDVSMVSMELHVLGAVAWTGGLGAVIVLLAGRRQLLTEALPRFSRLATICLFLVGVTGLFNALIVLALTPGIHWYAALFDTGYGVLVLLKIVCVVVLAGLGARVRFRLLPRIVRHERTALVAWTAVELAVMGLAFGFAVVLTRAPVIS